MKKVIVLLLMILPIMISVIVFAVAAFVGREVMYVEVTDVVAKSQTQLENAGYQAEGNKGWSAIINRGDTKGFLEHFRIVPARAKWSDITFEISNPDAVEITGGKIKVNQNRRESDTKLPGNDGNIRIAAKQGTKVFFTIYIFIPKTDNFDYLGFNYKMHHALNNYQEDAVYVNETGDALVLDSKKLDNKNDVDIVKLLAAGIDSAPGGDILNETIFPSLTFTSDKADILGISDPTAWVGGSGIVIVTFAGTYNGKTLQGTVKIEVI